MSNTSSEISSTCANCGKGEEAGISLKACTACKLVKYCSRDCQIAHRPQHKKECKRKAKELHDEKLFEQPPPLEDCPICMLRLPVLPSGRSYMPCCGKVLCMGCIHAVQSRAVEAGKREYDICPFCRTPTPESDDEVIKRLEKRTAMNDPVAIRHLGNHYSKGSYGLPQNMAKALELWHRAGELGGIGSADAYFNLSCAYREGNGVEVDEKKANHYQELAAIKGNVQARHNLGGMEGQSDMARARKHWMIAVRDGEPNCLNYFRNLYSKGRITKDEYTKALRSNQAYLDEIKSDQRNQAAAFYDRYKYY